MPLAYVDPAPAAYVGAILAAVRSFDQAGVGAVLDDADAIHGLDLTIDEVVFPALRLVGTFWAGGAMDIAHEHLLTGAVIQWVAARSALPPSIARQGTILLAAGPQDRHTLALDCLNLLLTSRGVNVCNLGAETPVASLLVVARALHPTAVVLSSQTPTVASEAVHSVETMAAAGLPVYFAGSSFVLQFFRQNAPGIPLDASLRESAAMLTARHTTALPGQAPVKASRRAAAAGVARAVVAAREVQAAEAAQSVVSTRHAVDAAARSAALAARSARAGRADAARAAAEAVAGRADRAAEAVQREADASECTWQHAAARAATALTVASETAAAAARVATAVAAAADLVARTVAELDAAIESEVAATAARVETIAAATARQVAAETFTRAAGVATVARDAVATASLLDDGSPLSSKDRSRSCDAPRQLRAPAPRVRPDRSSLRRAPWSPSRPRHHG